MAILPALPLGAAPMVGGAAKTNEMAPDAGVEPSLDPLLEGMNPDQLLPSELSPVQDAEDLSTRKKGWAEALNEMLSDPETPLLMFTMAQVMGQPLKPGENPMARIAQGFATGEVLKRQLKAGKAAEVAAGREEARKDFTTYVNPELDRRAKADKETREQDPGEYEKTRRSMTTQILSEQGLADTPANRRKVAKEVGERLSGRYSRNPAAATLPPTDPRWVDVKLHEELQTWDPLLNSGPYPYEERRQYWVEQQRLAQGGQPAPAPGSAPAAPIGMRRYNPKTGRIE